MFVNGKSLVYLVKHKAVTGVVLVRHAANTHMYISEKVFV